jgi:hypothetical protein
MSRFWEAEHRRPDQARAVLLPLVDEVDPKICGALLRGLAIATAKSGDGTMSRRAGVADECARLASRHPFRGRANLAALKPPFSTLATVVDISRRPCLLVSAEDSVALKYREQRSAAHSFA